MDGMQLCHNFRQTNATGGLVVPKCLRTANSKYPDSWLVGSTPLQFNMEPQNKGFKTYPHLTST